MLLIWALLLSAGPFFNICAQPLEIPRPPRSITQIPLRAAWIMQHFWDNASAGQMTEEQNFVNYLSLFPLAESDSLCSEAVRGLVQRCDSLSQGLSADILALAHKYLYDLDSPMADEERFLLFASGLQASSTLESVRRDELAYWQKTCLNNRVGQEMEDFSFEKRDGSLADFSETEGERLLVIFDPTCEDCKGLLDRIAADETEIAGGRRIVAVAVNTDRASFRRFAKSYPASWIMGWDSTHSINGGAIALRHLPDSFLVDGKGIVQKKHYLIR